MRKIILILLVMASSKAQAQKKLSWQVVLEINGQHSASPNIKTTTPFYRLVDSASNSFKKFNYVSGEETQTKTKTGISSGIYCSYPISKNVALHAGILISTYAIERTKKYTLSITDSVLVSLQRTTFGWTDPATGINYYHNSGGGYVFVAGNNSGYSLTGFGFNYSGNRRINPSEKINFIAIEIPVGATYKIPTSKFSFTVEISPSLVINSSVSGNKQPDPEISYIGGIDNSVSSILWRLGGGINYQINNKLTTGIQYKHFIKDILEENDPITFFTFGIYLKFALPGKK